MAQPQPADHKALLLRVSMIVFLTTAVSSVVFQSTTFALPKISPSAFRASLPVGDLWTSLGLPGRVDLATIVGCSPLSYSWWPRLRS